MIKAAVRVVIMLALINLFLYLLVLGYLIIYYSPLEIVQNNVLINFLPIDFV